MILFSCFHANVLFKETAFLTLTFIKAQVYRSIAYRSKWRCPIEASIMVLAPGSFSLNLTCSIYAFWLQLENKAQIHIIFIHEVLVWSSLVNNEHYELD